MLLGPHERCAALLRSSALCMSSWHERMHERMPAPPGLPTLRRREQDGFQEQAVALLQQAGEAAHHIRHHLACKQSTLSALCMLSMLSPLSALSMTSSAPLSACLAATEQRPTRRSQGPAALV